MFISDTLHHRIDQIIATRLGHSKSFVDVYNWLGNFEEQDHVLALTVLENLEYLPVARIVQIYDEGLQYLFKHKSQRIVIFLAIGEFGKSGSAMAYFLKQCPTFKDRRYKRTIFLASSNDHLITLIEDHNLNVNELVVILVDDFIGSGRSTVEYLEGTKDIEGLLPLLDKHQIVLDLAILSIIILKDGMRHIKTKYQHIIVAGERRGKVFLPNRSVFGYRPRMIPIREFAYRYGSLLTRADHVLGFENSQALVAFSHTTPNNTLPIFWASVKGWQPLYPRFGKDKIDQAKRFRADSNYWLSIARSLHITVFDVKKVIPYSEENVQLITMMRLKALRRVPPVICQIMGITLNEYAAIIETGRARKLFLLDGELSALAKKIHEQIRKQVAMQQAAKNNIFENFDQTVYLPVAFRGKT